jgi:hypothetical protein
MTPYSRTLLTFRIEALSSYKLSKRKPSKEQTLNFLFDLVNAGSISFRNVGKLLPDIPEQSTVYSYSHKGLKFSIAYVHLSTLT